MQTTNLTGMRRRNSNRIANCYHPGRVGTSCGQPMPVSYYLDEVLEAVRKRDIHKVRQILTVTSHG